MVQNVQPLRSVQLPRHARLRLKRLEGFEDPHPYPLPPKAGEVTKEKRFEKFPRPFRWERARVRASEATGGSVAVASLLLAQSPVSLTVEAGSTWPRDSHAVLHFYPRAEGFRSLARPLDDLVEFFTLGLRESGHA
jgi:hypothetical protein